MWQRREEVNCTLLWRIVGYIDLPTQDEDRRRGEAAWRGSKKGWKQDNGNLAVLGSVTGNNGSILALRLPERSILNIISN
mgnify:CR=1 FL=1